MEPSSRRPPRERPIDRAWPALPLAALGVALLVALVGILAAPARSPADQVRDAAKDLAIAAQAGRGAQTCALLTPTERATVLAETGTLDCPASIRTFGLGFDASALRRATIAHVSVVGATATIARDDIRFPGGQDFSTGLRFAREGGHWRFAGAGG